MRLVITAGSIRLPVSVHEMVQGQWRVRLPDATELGSVNCRGMFIGNFRKPFAVLGAEPADMATFEFDLPARTVTVRVGGIGLLEALQDPAAPPETETVDL